LERDELIAQLRAHRDELAVQLRELAEPVRAPGVQMQFGKRAGDHTADAVLQMQRTMTAGQLQQVAADIDRALEKIQEDTYGICDECGQPIGEDRLEAITWALRCVRCQAAIVAEHEEQRRPIGLRPLPVLSVRAGSSLSCRDAQRTVLVRPISM